MNCEEGQSPERSQGQKQQDPNTRKVWRHWERDWSKTAQGYDVGVRLDGTSIHQSVEHRRKSRFRGGVG